MIPNGGGLWHYLGSFMFYTLAAIGLLYAAYWQIKKNPGLLTFSKNGISSKESLQVESFLALEARKNLYVIKAGNERFLLSTSPEGTQFLSRLETATTPEASELEAPETSTSSVSNHNPLRGFFEALRSLQRLRKREV